MAATQSSKPIVVGLDGTQESLHAVAWALGAAARRKAPVVLIHAFEFPPPLLPVYDAAVDFDEEHLRGIAQAALSRAVAEASSLEAGVDISGAVRDGTPIKVLLDAAREAAMVVVGTRGTGPLGELVVGSTGTALAAQATCPVVVVPATDWPVAATSSVVVGIDGSAHGQAALVHAMEEASLQGTMVTAVHAWRPAPTGLSASSSPAQWRRDHADQVEHRLLVAEAFAGMPELYPDVGVIEKVVRDHPVSALLDAAHGASLLVVGARGTGDYPGQALGSVAQAVLHHARGPVCVVPD
jgi:nucleotide-binding universal stress UspA family protein